MSRFEFRFNQVFWLRSLNAIDVGVSNRIIEDLEVLCCSQGISFSAIEIRDEGEFDTELEQIIDETSLGGYPLIVFDGHADEEHGFYIASTNTYIAWEKVYHSLREVNIISRNNLGVMFNCCYGAAILLETSIYNQVAPFTFLIATIDKVSNGFLEINVNSFFSKFMSNKNIVSAHNEYLSKHFLLLDSMSLFENVMLSYYSNHCRGKNLQKRRERLLSIFLDTPGIINNRDQRQKARKFIRELVKVTPNFYYSMAKKFLMGRKPKRTYREFMRVAKKP